VSSKKSTRSTPPVPASAPETQPSATPVAKSRPAPSAAKAKAPATGTPAVPEAASTPRPVTKPAAKAKAKPAAAKVVKPKPAAAPARAAGNPAAPGAPEQPTASASPTAAAIVDAAATEVVRVVTDEDIRIRAYFLSIEHRARGGSDIDFWLIAERELRHGIKAND
jgi:hypothetical protein